MPDLDLDNVLEIIEIKKLISHEKKLLEFFNELIKLKNIMINESSDCSPEENFSDYDSDCSPEENFSDSDYSISD